MNNNYIYNSPLLPGNKVKGDPETIRYKTKKKALS